jgi:hypothetical protein
MASHFAVSSPSWYCESGQCLLPLLCSDENAPTSQTLDYELQMYLVSEVGFVKVLSVNNTVLYAESRIYSFLLVTEPQVYLSHLLGVQPMSLRHTFRISPSTDILNLHIPTTSGAQITSQRPSKQLLQHLKTHPRECGIIPPLTQLIPNKRMLRPRRLVK